MLPITACGHATLAAAHVAFGVTGENTLVFDGPQCLLPVSKTDDGRIVMRYPKYQAVPYTHPALLLAALGIDRPLASDHCSELHAMFLETRPDALRRLRPDFPRVTASCDMFQEVVVSAVDDTAGHDSTLKASTLCIAADAASFRLFPSRASRECLVFEEPSDKASPAGQRRP